MKHWNHVIVIWNLRQRGENAVILQMEIYLNKHRRWKHSCPTPQHQICTEGGEAARGHFASSHWGSEKERNTPQGILDVRAIWPWHLSLVRSQGGWAWADWPGRSLLLPISWPHVLCQITWLSGKEKKKRMFQTTLSVLWLVWVLSRNPVRIFSVSSYNQVLLSTTPNPSC